MKSAKTTFVLWVSTLLWLTGCASYKVPNIRFYAEIPFIDAPEGLYVESVTGKTGLIPAEEWAKMRPLMIMVDPDGKKAIFMGWSEGCRVAGKNCNIQLKTVRTTVDKIDAITAKYLKY